jgi:DNA-binding NarL/FixJ family response regulator
MTALSETQISPPFSTPSVLSMHAPSAPQLVGGQVRVVVLERDPLLRAGIRSIMQAQPRIQVVGAFESSRHAAAGIPATPPSVVLAAAECLDEGYRTAMDHLARGGQRREPGLVAMLSAADDATLWQALGCSARGYVDRGTADVDLNRAVLEVHGGGTYLSSSIADSLVRWAAARIGHEPVSRAEVERALTRRELEIFVALGDGITNTAIARRLHIQETTVRSHIYHILVKLRLRTRTEAVLAGHGYANGARAAVPAT